ncbi:hypothetical protein GQ44DRAFT_762151 [Phaeosphaeriaceae sp. PMI808]|nr:hypothetical protein GQ44DRAFT_762151 [Phaeosphaeriaceae sp. PMI808]
MPPAHREVVIASVEAALASVAAVIAQLGEEPTGVRAYKPYDGLGQRWLQDCRSNPLQLYSETRLREPVFDALVNRFMVRELVSGEELIVAEKTLIYLYICAQGASFRNVRYRCGHSLDTISQLVTIST